MFADFDVYFKTKLSALNSDNSNVDTVETITDLSFANYSTACNTTENEQIICAFPAFTWTNGTNQGNCTGLKTRRKKVRRIFVLRRLNQWRLSELS